MPKMKTKKTVTKKVRVTRNGKVVRQRAFAAHLRTKRSVQEKARGKKTKVELRTSAPWNKLIK